VTALRIPRLAALTAIAVPVAAATIAAMAESYRGLLLWAPRRPRHNRLHSRHVVVPGEGDRRAGGVLAWGYQSSPLNPENRALCL
jgi:hypothetical protein